MLTSNQQLPRTILLTGGVASGKSAYGERLAMLASGPRYYIATMIPFGPDADLKVQHHRDMRAGKGFATIECYTDIASVELSDGAPTTTNESVVLLECLGNLVANSMYSEQGELLDQEAVFQEIIEGICHLQDQCDHLIVVTNEVGDGGSEYPSETRAYMDMLGRLNNLLASKFEAVAQLVFSMPTTLKGVLPCVQ